VFICGYLGVKNMGRYTGPSCKLCRREGIKLFLKGKKCETEKCILEKRPVPPGKLPKYRKKKTDYAIQLREKQKIKRYYSISDTQLSNYTTKAVKMKGISAENLMLLLERRLDNVVVKLGFATSKKFARQLISHKQILVNSKCVSISSYLVKKDDIIEFKEKFKKSKCFVNIQESIKNKQMPEWIELNDNLLIGTIKQLPSYQMIASSLPTGLNEQKVIDFYSKK
jgi:small subunit ribosomal protein S4